MYLTPQIMGNADRKKEMNSYIDDIEADIPNSYF